MSSSSSTTNAMARGTIAGYFSSGEDARRAVNQLMQEGFSTTEIGAAFHSSSSGRRSSGTTAESNENITIPPAGRADSTSGGAASGTERVFPWGLQTGGGTVFAGASQPGPIPGSEIPSNLPRDIPSELASDSASRATPRSHTNERDQPPSRREPVSDKSALNYGTGEGHLPLSTNYNYAYSGSAFESSFSGMGIPQEHARRLSRELRRGGAVVTVRGGSRNSTAEAVMQRNNGVIRYESAPGTGDPAWESGAQEPRVEVYGEIHRVYPGYIPKEDVRSRKAS